MFPCSRRLQCESGQNCDWASIELLQDALDDAIFSNSQRSGYSVVNLLDFHWLILFMSPTYDYHTSKPLHTNLTVMMAFHFGKSVMWFEGFLLWLEGKLPLEACAPVRESSLYITQHERNSIILTA